MTAKRNYNQDEGEGSGNRDIGSMTGAWSTLFKFSMALTSISLPGLITLNVFFVSSIHRLEIQQSVIKTQVENFMAVDTLFREREKFDIEAIKSSIISDLRKEERLVKTK